MTRRSSVTYENQALIRKRDLFELIHQNHPACHLLPVNGVMNRNSPVNFMLDWYDNVVTI